MLCAVVDLCCVRVAVVKVAPAALVEPLATRTIRELQPRFGVLPILMIAFADAELSDVQGFSEFPTAPYLADLVEWHGMEPVEWEPLPELAEEELPF
jgi:hypothetical protein